MIIWCIEDDAGIRDIELYTLSQTGFEAKGFPDSTGLWEALHTVRPELIMLDIMLPGEDGITILKKLRESSATADIPVIMATAKGTEYDKVIGLDLGADDYLAKPFGMMEMVSRVRAVLRRSAPHSSGVLTVGPIALDVVRHRVTVGGNEVTLTLKEFDLIELLMRNPGKVYSREQLLDLVWGYDYQGDIRTVDVHIRRLREKLERNPAAPEYIITKWGVGYYFAEA